MFLLRVRHTGLLIGGTDEVLVCEQDYEGIIITINIFRKFINQINLAPENKKDI